LLGHDNSHDRVCTIQEVIFSGQLQALRFVGAELDHQGPIPSGCESASLLGKNVQGQQAMQYQLDHATEILRRTPPILNSLLRHLPEEWIFSTEGPETWSPFDVVGHLIHGEKTDWIPRAKIILEYGESRSFEPFDRYAMFGESRGKSLSDLLDRFEQLREVSLKELEEMHLTPEMLEKRGMHPELGVVTLSQLLSTWVVHDLGHIGQIVRVMSKQYSEAVGPWQGYLPVLTR
jgi:DinB superfamily